MQSKRRLILFVTAFAVVFGFLTIAAPLFAASTEKVLHSFSNGKGGHSPKQGVIFDAAGNLYGVTTYGGGHENAGTVFKLTPSASGKWTETVLYSFCSATSCTDGDGPFGGLILDSNGNLYGTTVAGGTGQVGTVFKLAPDGKGGWIETVLHSFSDSDNDGSEPFAGVVMDPQGNLYGTTTYGGSGGVGTAFQLSLNADGTWTESVLHSFCSASNCTDGENPYGPLTLDSAGNLYGMTYSGGNIACNPFYGCGTVFELTPGANGEWTETVLHTFNRTDGDGPSEGLIFDAAGNLYGTTEYGGDLGCDHPVGCGTVFELTPGANGEWTETVLHSFYKYPKNPASGLIFDGSGNLYGTTLQGGTYDGGTLFKLTPGTGGWTPMPLYSFRSKRGDEPEGTLVFDSAGNLYGSTIDGGRFNNCDQACGVVFEITP